MRLDDILSRGGRSKPRKRRGRGVGSGKGKTCGRGHKGRGQRSGASSRLGYEGGQNPALMRIPKRGFNNANFATRYQVVNVADLEAFDDGDRVDTAALAAKSLVRPDGGPVKILAGGELTRKKLTVAAHAFSEAAEKKITDAGGSVERL
ncbi:MAG: 50S ribosomal protein L15 [Planctomycetota bacterium]